MGEIGRDRYVLETDKSSFSRGLKEAEGEAQRSFRSIGKSFKAMGPQFAAAGRGLTAGLTLPILGIGAVATKSFLDFDRAMTNSLAIMGDVSEGMKRDLRDTAREVAKSTTFSHEQSAESIFFLASAGLKANEIIGAMPIVARFAQAGNFDLALATDLATDAQSALGLKSKDLATGLTNLTRVQDVLVRANQISNATVQQFAESITQQGGAALRGFNKELEEGVGLLAFWADQGLKGSAAGNALASMLQLLPKAAENNSEAFEKYGIQLFDSEGKLKSFADIAREFEPILTRLTDEQRTQAFAQLGINRRLATGILMLKGGADSIDEYTTQLMAAGGATDEVADKQLKAFSAQMSLLRSELTDAAIELGSVLVPILVDFAKAMRPIIRLVARLAVGFGKLPKPLQVGIIAFAGFLAVLGPVLVMIGFMIPAITALIAIAPALGTAFLVLLGPVGLVILALAALIVIGVLVVKNWDAIVSFFKTEVGPALEAIGQAIKQLWEDIEEAVGDIKDFVIGAFTAVLDFVRGRWPEIATLLAGPFAPLVALATDAFGIRSRLVRVLKDLAGAAFDFGKDIVIQLKDGFLDAVASFFRVLADFVGEVTDRLNPFNWKFSPDTLLEIYEKAGREAGQTLGEGIADGLGEAAAQVRSAALEPVRAVREALLSLQGELGRLTRLPTRTSVQQQLRLTRLRLKLLRAEGSKKEKGELALLRQLKRAGFGSAESRQRREQLEARLGGVEAIKDEIDVLERVIREREFENEILRLRGQLADQTIVSDREMQVAAEGLILRIEDETRALTEQVSVIWTQYIPAMDAMGASVGGVGDEMEDFTDSMDDLSGIDLGGITQGIRGIVSSIGDFVALRAPDPFLFAAFLGFRGASTAEILRALELVGTLPSRPILVLPELTPTPIPVPAPPGTPTPMPMLPVASSSPSDGAPKMDFWAPITIQVPTTTTDRFAEDLYRMLAEE